MSWFVACSICGEERSRRGEMCPPCCMSYDRYARDTGTVIEAIEWAAARARRFERRRHKRPRSSG